MFRIVGEECESDDSVEGVFDESGVLDEEDGPEACSSMSSTSWLCVESPKTVSESVWLIKLD